MGRPWKYETLYAPFDFGIEKSEEDIEEEKAKISSNITPYYRRNNVVEREKKARFVDQFNKQLKLTTVASLNTIQVDSLKNLNYGLTLLNELYDIGIIQLEDSHKDPEKTREINLLTRDNLASRKKVSDLLSVRQAYKEVRNRMQQPPRGIEPGILLPLVERSIDHNVFYDDSTTIKFQEERLGAISPTRGLVQEGEIIITKGGIVTDIKFKALASFESEYDRRVVGVKKGQLVYLGNLILIGLIVTVFMIFLFAFSKDVFHSTRKVFFIFVLTTMMVALISKLVETDLPILYAIPVCILPIVLRNFFGARLALHAHIMLVLLAAFIVPIGLEYSILHLLAGMVAIFTTIRAYYYTQFFISNAFIMLTYMVGYFAISIMQEGSLQNINYENFGWLVLNALLLFLAYPFTTIFEKAFGFISELTLLELSDINKPLLKEMQLKAPGTFQHSLQVANLAEAAAYEVGANTLLVKVGALYHDIGKMNNPLYFIENQKGNHNPHDDIGPEKSAQIIIDHILKGIDMAKKAALPDVLIDFIRTHHGTTRVEYFYRQYQKDNPDEVVDDSMFTYPGPMPYSKETAIVMMADSCEAAARSLDDPSNKDIDNLVDALIQSKIDQNQFANCNITFKEIYRIRKLMKKMLYSIYHVRVAYPDGKNDQ